MSSTPYQTTKSILKATDFTPLSITAGTVYAQADIQSIKTALEEIEALLEASGENGQA